MEGYLFYFFITIKQIDIKVFNKIDVFKYLFSFGNLPNIEDSLMWFMYAYLSVLIISPLFKYFFDGLKDNKKFLYAIILVLIFGGFILSDINLLMRFIATIFSKKVYSFDTLKTIYPFSGYGQMLACYLLGGVFYKNNIYNKYEKRRKIIMFLSFLGIIISVIGLLCIKYYYTRSFTWQGIYLIAGFYLYDGLLRNKKTIYVVVCTIICIILTILYQFILFNNNIVYDLWYNNLFLFASSIGIYELFLRIKDNNGCIDKVVCLISKYSLGIFFLHAIVKNILNPYVKELYVPDVIKVIILSLLNIMICFGIIHLFKIIKPIQRHIFFVK